MGGVGDSQTDRQTGMHAYTGGGGVEAPYASCRLIDNAYQVQGNTSCYVSKALNQHSYKIAKVLARREGCLREERKF